MQVMLNPFKKGWGGNMESFNCKEGLKKFNLSPVEIDIFSELINLSSASLGELIKRVDYHKGTVYNTLNQLIKKGFVCVSYDKDRMTYHTNPDSLLGFVEIERKKIDELKDVAKKINEAVKTSKTINSSPDDFPVKIYYGEPAFKNFFAKLLNECGSKEKIYSTICEGGEMQDILGKEYYIFSQQLKQKLDVDCKVILNTIKKIHPFSEQVKGKIRWIGGINFPAHTYVFDKKTYIVDWFSKPMTLIEINSPNIANSYQSMFDSLWKNKALRQNELMIH